VGTLRQIDRREPKLEAVGIQDLALDNLRYIRQTMESAGSFTALAASVVAFVQTRPAAWLGVWLAEALVALVIGVAAARIKAGDELLSGPARKFVLALMPAIFAGAVLTLLFVRHGLFSEIPALWLLLYGTAVVSGGSFSVRVVPIMGICFLVLGLVTAFVPSSWGNWMLAAGFGGLQIIFGAVIARKFGG
jgi:hypothetical protein